MTRPWHYLVNQILNTTNSSYIKMVVISTWHYQKIKAKAGDAFFDGLILLYTPLQQALIEAYNTWKAAGGTEEGNTAELVELMQELSSDKAEEWDLEVQRVYRKSTSKYKGLLPNFRKDFQKGTYLERINAVEAFSIRIGTDAALATLKADVDAFYSLMVDVDDNKGQQQGKTTASSAALEAARVAASIGQYRNLGKCMDKFAEEPLLAAPYFDIANISSKSQVRFTHTLDPQEIYNVVKRTLAEGQTLTFTYNGPSGVLVAYPAASADDQPGTVTHDIQVGETLTFTKIEFGNTKELPYINVFNKSTLEGSFEMEIK